MVSGRTSGSAIRELPVICLEEPILLGDINASVNPPGDLDPAIEKTFFEKIRFLEARSSLHSLVLHFAKRGFFLKAANTSQL